MFKFFYSNLMLVLSLLRFVKFLFLDDERGEKKNFGKMR